MTSPPSVPLTGQVGGDTARTKWAREIHCRSWSASGRLTHVTAARLNPRKHDELPARVEACRWTRLSGRSGLTRLTLAEKGSNLNSYRNLSAPQRHLAAAQPAATVAAAKNSLGSV